MQFYRERERKKNPYESRGLISIFLCTPRRNISDTLFHLFFSLSDSRRIRVRCYVSQCHCCGLAPGQPPSHRNPIRKLLESWRWLTRGDFLLLSHRLTWFIRRFFRPLEEQLFTELYRKMAIVTNTYFRPQNIL